MHKKVSFYAMIALFIVILLAGCARPGVQVGEEQRGGTIVLGFYQEPESLNINLVTQIVASEVNEFFNDALLGIDPDGEYVPELAKEVPSVQNGGISEDGLTITYHLRDGVKWSDGEPCTCDDWKFTWEVIMHPESGAKSNTGWRDLAAIMCPDEQTIVFEFERFYAPHLQTIGTSWVLPRHATGDPAQMQSWEYNRKPLANGPFQVQEWVSGDHITLVPNEHFYIPGQPYLDQVIFRFIPSREVGKQLIQTGEIDILRDLVEADIPDLEDKPGVVLSGPASTRTERLVLNLRDPNSNAPCADEIREKGLWHWALGDVRVRQAIRYGIDLKLINDRLLYGKATLGTAEINMGWAKPDIPVAEFNPDEAKKLLEEAGWLDTDGDGIRECRDCLHAEEGTQLRLKIQTTSGNKLREDTQQVLMDMMKTIGIELYIENVPSAEFFGSYANQAFRPRGNFDIIMYTTSYGPDPQGLFEGYYASWNIPCDDNNGRGFNFHRWVNDEFDELIRVAGESPDMETRKQAYQRGSELIHEEVPAIYLYDRMNLNAYRSTLQGWVDNSWQGMGWNSGGWWLETD